MQFVTLLRNDRMQNPGDAPVFKTSDCSSIHKKGLLAENFSLKNVICEIKTHYYDSNGHIWERAN